MHTLSLDNLETITGGVNWREVRNSAVDGAALGALFAGTYSAGALAVPGLGLGFAAAAVGTGVILGGAAGAATSYFVQRSSERRR